MCMTKALPREMACLVIKRLQAVAGDWGNNYQFPAKQSMLNRSINMKYKPAPGLPIFSLSRGYRHPPPLLEFFRGYFHPPVHQLRVRRYHCMFQAAKLSQDLNVTKSCFECSLWILSVMHTASNNRKTAVILMLIQVCFLLHSHKCFVTNGRNSHFFRLTHSTKL